MEDKPPHKDAEVFNPQPEGIKWEEKHEVKQMREAAQAVYNKIGWEEKKGDLTDPEESVEVKREIFYDKILAAEKAAPLVEDISQGRDSYNITDDLYVEGNFSENKPGRIEVSIGDYPILLDMMALRQNEMFRKSINQELEKAATHEYLHYSRMAGHVEDEGGNIKPDNQAMRVGFNFTRQRGWLKGDQHNVHLTWNPFFTFEGRVPVETYIDTLVGPLGHDNQIEDEDGTIEYLPRVGYDNLSSGDNRDLTMLDIQLREKGLIMEGETLYNSKDRDVIYERLKETREAVRHKVTKPDQKFH